MAAGAIAISDYRYLNNSKRVQFIFRHFSNLCEYIEGYEKSLCDLLMAERTMAKQKARDELGVRVQTSGHSDPTAREAVERVDIMDRIQAGDDEISSEVMKCEGGEELIIDIEILHQMRRDYDFVVHAMGVLPAHERNDLEAVLEHEKEIAGLADEKGILIESARMQIYRSKKKVRMEAVRFMERIGA